MKQDKSCSCCAGGTKPLSYPEGGHCDDTGIVQIDVPHPSHKMTEWRTEICCPGSTPRFYGVRECEHCKAEGLKHPAGHFLDDLLKPCSGEE